MNRRNTRSKSPISDAMTTQSSGGSARIATSKRPCRSASKCTSFRRVYRTANCWGGSNCVLAMRWSVQLCRSASPVDSRETMGWTSIQAVHPRSPVSTLAAIARPRFSVFRTRAGSNAAPAAARSTSHASSDSSSALAWSSFCSASPGARWRVGRQRRSMFLRRAAFSCESRSLSDFPGERYEVFETLSGMPRIFRQYSFRQSSSTKTVVP